MAEIFKNPELILTPSVNAPSVGGKEHTGNNEIDAFINSLPEDEREDALLAITAPKTGEDVHNEMLASDQAGEIRDPNKEDWLKLNQFYRTRDTDYLKALSEGAGEVYKTFGKALTSLSDDPSMENFGKVTPSVFEGAVQNVRMLYGIAAESADSTSLQAKFFNILNGRIEDSDEAYRVFLEARNFNRESQQYIEGKKTILVDKNHLNNDFVQAAALIADPTMFIPFGKAFSVAGGVLGMSERSMALSARTAAIKNKLLGGALKYGVGMPIEFIGKGTRVTLDHAIATGEKAFVAATGVSSETFREGMRMTGVGSLGAGYFGHSVPLLTDASGAYVAGTAAAGVGEAVSVIGHQMIKGERGIASYAKQALIDSAKQGVELSAHSKALLKIVNGFDPLVDYTTTIAQGAAHGSMIGAGLGYWSGGEEGMAHGIGAGIALGSIGGTAGKMLADVTGRTTRHRTHIQAKLVLEGLRDIHPEQAHSWERAEAWARTRGFSLDGILAAKDTIHPNTHIEVLTNREYARYLAENGLNPDTYDGKTFLKDGDQPLSLRSFEQQNGYVVENRANGTVKIYLNADAAPRATMGHELFHSILRNSVMKDYYAQAVKEKVIGARDAQGNLTNKGVVDASEVKQMFRRYLDAEFKDPAERADAQARLEMAEDAFEGSGQLVSDPSLGGRPLLEHLSEEFGAYYFSHLVMDKPIDWLYHGGDLPGIRGVLDNAKMQFRDYWRSRMNMTAPEFDFNRTFIDENGFEKLVPIDEVFAPAKRDMFGNITGKTKRVVNPAMDLFFRDMLRIEKKVNETGQFDITKLDKKSQQRYIDSEGLDGIFTKDEFGNYQHSTEAQIKRENKIKGKAVYQLLMGIPEAERTFIIDADGNIRGHLTPQMLDNIVNAGHMSRAMANKISLFQSIARGEAAGNLVDFGGIGSTAERPMDVNNPSRMYGKRVPYKSRTAIVFGLDTVIGKNGKFQFKGNMLDYKVIETRANNEWSNADVQRLWNGNHTEYLADFFRYLENASKSHDDSTRVPSAELWTDGKGNERRNVLHQVLGMAKGEADTFLNTPKAEINRNAYSTVMSFSLNRMSNLRLRNQNVPFKFENAYRDLVRNWSPSEMDSELTPRGTIFKHPSGYRFVQRQDGKTDAFDELGKRIGTYQTANEATEAGRRYAAKHPSTVMLKDNMKDTSGLYQSPNEGVGEIPNREYPIYEDSIGGIGSFELPRGSEPFPVRDILDFTQLPKEQTPDPKKHSLWQMLEHAKRTERKLTIREVLDFVKNQGVSVHSNIRRGYLSQWAEALELFIVDENPNVVIESGRGEAKGWKHKGGENVVQFNEDFERRIKEKDDTKNKDEEGEGEGEGEEGKKKLKAKPDYTLSDAEKVSKITSIKSSENALHLNLEELVDRMYGSSRRKKTEYKKNQEGKLTATVELSEAERMQDLFVGHSFEGTALEEIGHALFDRSTKQARASDPILEKITDRYSDKSHSSGVEFKRDVDALIAQNEARIKNGLYVDPVNLAWTRLFKIHKHICENIYVTNGKSTTSLWDSKAIDFNTLDKKTKFRLKEGYSLVDKEGRNLYHDFGQTKVTSTYRFNNPQEFLVSLFNDPQALSRISDIPFNPELLEGLRNEGNKDRLLKNEEKLAEELSQSASIYLSEDKVPKQSIVNQMVEEAVTLLALARRTKDGVLQGNDIKDNKVSHRYHQGIYQPKKRPVGAITPWEKWYIGTHRKGLAEIAKRKNARSPLEGLSDWEAWQELKKPQYQNPTYEPWVPFHIAERAKQTPIADTPVTETPVTETPVTETPVTETPVAETPVTETPVTEKPVTETPEVVVNPDEVTVETPVIGVSDIFPPPPPPKPPKTPKPTPTTPTTPAPTTPAPTQPAPIPRRTFTDADIRVWRSWKTETYGNGSALKNAIGYIIMSVNKNFRVYNPEKVLIGIYKDEEEAKRRVQREEPKR